MNLRHLRYFVTVADERHFGRAAERLHIAQPPLSQQIRRLEADVGVELLHRTTRRVELTAAGEIFLERARTILADVDGAADEARRVASGSAGHLTIGCVGTATYSLLPSLARRLADELPGVDFSFRGDMLVPEQIDALRAGTIDIGLLRPPVADLSLRVQTLRAEPWVVALPAAHPLAGSGSVALPDLAGAALIVHSADRRSAMHDRVLALFRAADIEPTIRHEVGETSTLATLVAGGLGVAVVPEPVTALKLDGLVYRPLAVDSTVELAVAHVADRSEPALATTLEVITGLF